MHLVLHEFYQPPRHHRGNSYYPGINRTVQVNATGRVTSSFIHASSASSQEAQAYQLVDLSKVSSKGLRSNTIPWKFTHARFSSFLLPRSCPFTCLSVYVSVETLPPPVYCLDVLLFCFLTCLQVMHGCDDILARGAHNLNGRTIDTNCTTTAWLRQSRRKMALFYTVTEPCCTHVAG